MAVRRSWSRSAWTVREESCPLGFWEGATENHEILRAIAGGAGAERIKTLQAGALSYRWWRGYHQDAQGPIRQEAHHQRCTLHKDRNIQPHLPKRYRKQAHHLFATALEQNSYKDAKKMLGEFERWLRSINESAADSLVEALEEILTLHRLKVPALLRKSLHSTNPIESMFSMVRQCERNIKRYRSSKMRQRWLAAVLMHCEQQFRRIKGHASIDDRGCGHRCDPPKRRHVQGRMNLGSEVEGNSHESLTMVSTNFLTSSNKERRCVKYLSIIKLDN